jgi:CheY-like chemotaxis protein
VKRILLIEDDPSVRLFMAKVLGRAGYRVTEAGEGAEGLRLQRDEPADLIITDLIMPGKEGLETIMELRRQFPLVKVVAISGGGRNKAGDYLPVAKKLGANRTLAKPFLPADLLSVVAELLNGEP